MADFLAGSGFQKLQEMAEAMYRSSADDLGMGPSAMGMATIYPARAIPKTVKELAEMVRSGLVFHGTTAERGEKILEEGFRPLVFGDEVREALKKLGDPKLSIKQNKNIGQIASSYKSQGGTVSVTPSQPVASRWAGKGGEIAGTIADWIGKNREAVAGEPVIVEAELNTLPRRAHSYIRNLEDLMNPKWWSEPISEEDAIRMFLEDYTDWRVKPEHINPIRMTKVPK